MPQPVRALVEGSSSLRRAKAWIHTRTVGHDDLYDADYYVAIDATAVQSAEVMADSIVRDFTPRTALDVGCGTGALLELLSRKGVVCAGLEYADAALAYCRARALDVRKFDVESAQPLGRQYDVVISTEVAEHLPATLADRFVDLLCAHGRIVVFTAATPGQGGMDHVNEQPHEYWIAKFSERGFVYERERSMQWRDAWTQKGTAWWYSKNLMVFREATRPRP
jgi:SAM-dependent methyltransferase